MGARVDKLRTLIRDVYTKHNPKKLEGLDQLLDKHLGLLEGVYAHICKKYGEEAVDVPGGQERTEVSEAGKTAVNEDCEAAGGPTEIQDSNSEKEGDGNEDDAPPDEVEDD